MNPARGTLYGAAIGVAALTLGGLLMLLMPPQRPLGAYLMACQFWLGLSLGALVILLIHRITGGHWGIIIQVPLKAAVAPLPLLAVLFLPLNLAVETVFSWAPMDQTTAELIQKKALYLDSTFLQLRTAGYFLIWIILALLLKPWNPNPTADGQGRSALGLILYALTVTFFAVDWIMALEPTWYSTAVGFITAAGQLMAGLAFAVIALGWLGPPGIKDNIQDLGNLLLAAIMFWLYVFFMEYLIIWSGNLPHEITWYLHRSRHGWDTLGVLSVLLAFVVPFTLLLSRRIKRSLSMLTIAASFIVLGYGLHLFWLIIPVFHPQRVPFPWLESLAILGVGGFWAAIFLGCLGIQNRYSAFPPGRSTS